MQSIYCWSMLRLLITWKLDEAFNRENRKNKKAIRIYPNNLHYNGVLSKVSNQWQIQKCASGVMFRPKRYCQDLHHVRIEELIFFDSYAMLCQDFIVVALVSFNGILQTSIMVLCYSSISSTYWIETWPSAYIASSFIPHQHNQYVGDIHDKKMESNVLFIK